MPVGQRVLEYQTDAPHLAGNCRVNAECLSVGILVADHLCAPIDHVPHAGELVLAESLSLEVGGCAANTAVDLARLGVRVGVVGRVGRDVLGRFIVEQLTAAGVDTTDVELLPNVGTSGTLIINVKNEDRPFIASIGANAVLRVADIPRDRLRAARVLYVGGYLYTPGLDAEELSDLFHQARQAGVTTVLDVVVATDEDHWPALACVLAETDVFLPNEDEAALLSGESDPRRQAQHFRDAGAQTVVITCGDQGTLLASDSLQLRAGVYPTDYVGGTGAGDAFDAGYIAGLLAGGDPRTCLEWGSALGSSCVRAVGATQSVFTRPDAQQMIAAHPLKIEPW